MICTVTTGGDNSFSADNGSVLLILIAVELQRDHCSSSYLEGTENSGTAEPINGTLILLN